VEPAYHALHQHVLSGPWVHADETTWQLLGHRHLPSEVKAGEWYVWVAHCPDAAFHLIQPKRDEHGARELLTVPELDASDLAIDPTLLTQPIQAVQIARCARQLDGVACCCSSLHVDPDQTRTTPHHPPHPARDRAARVRRGLDPAGWRGAAAAPGGIRPAGLLEP
jgi:hypothetical protein